jgi:hypothetical protein
MSVRTVLFLIGFFGCTIMQAFAQQSSNDEVGKWEVEGHGGLVVHQPIRFLWLLVGYFREKTVHAPGGIYVRSNNVSARIITEGNTIAE